ncbi:Mitochondrial group I intron splicing factor ccm1 [Chytriomyces hyalinus]|nr:Mitochondrial group I intron splicing factor ccm1 [Chytriomyces hyalinus]
MHLLRIVHLVRQTVPTRQTRSYRVDPSLVRDLKIPSFKEFRGQLKESRRSPTESKRNRNNAAVVDELLSGKESQSQSGLSSSQMNDLHRLLSDSGNPGLRMQKRIASGSAGSGVALKVVGDFIAQFAPVTNGSAAMRLPRPVSNLAEDKVRIEDVTRVIRMNALLGRTEEAQAAFDMIAEEGLEPDCIAVNALMDAYAAKGDYKATAGLFAKYFNHEASNRDIQQETDGTDTNLQPDIASYSILIKACINAKNLKGAFAVYEGMKTKGVNPNVQIFTSLIKGCLENNDLKRAWRTFDFMRGEICSPDSTCYSLMIHACSLDMQAERALDLFQEMHNAGLVATEVTYTALLKALASRPDYHEEMWAIVDQMVEAGWEVNNVACKVLIRSCGENGNIARLRSIWNWMIYKASTGDSSIQVDETIHRGVLEALSFCIRLQRRIRKESLPTPQLEPTNETTEAETPEPDPEILEEIETASEIAIREATQALRESPIFVEPIPANHALSHLHLGNTDKTPYAIIADASRIWANLVESRPELVSSKLVDAYLGVFCAVPGNIVTAATAMKIYDQMYVSDASIKNASENESTSGEGATTTPTTKLINGNTSLSNPVPKTANTYKLVLELVTKDKKLMVERGSDIWSEYLAWDQLQETKMLESAVHGNLTAGEKEAKRVREGRGKNALRDGFVSMIKGHARTNQVESALDVLEAATIFRQDPTYLPPISFTHIPNLVDRVRDLAQDGDLVPAKRLKELCPPPAPQNAMDEVKQMLQSKWSGSDNWWGWEAVGIDENVRRKVIRQQKKESDRVKMYWENKRQQHKRK